MSHTHTKIDSTAQSDYSGSHLPAVVSESKGALRLPIKSAGMEKFPWRLGHAMLSGRFWRERFTAGPRLGGKGNKSVIPRARSRRWAVFIAIFICHGEEANGIFLHSVYQCAKTKVWMAFTVYRLSRFDAVIVVWMRPNRDIKVPASPLSKIRIVVQTSQLTPWRNGSASDSRSEGCVFESRRGQVHFFRFLLFDLSQPGVENAFFGHITRCNGPICLRCKALDQLVTNPCAMAYIEGLKYRIFSIRSSERLFFQQPSNPSVYWRPSD